jgi:hypothetical protein
VITAQAEKVPPRCFWTPYRRAVYPGLFVSVIGGLRPQGRQAQRMDIRYGNGTFEPVICNRLVKKIKRLCFQHAHLLLRWTMLIAYLLCSESSRRRRKVVQAASMSFAMTALVAVAVMAIASSPHRRTSKLYLC